MHYLPFVPDCSYHYLKNKLTAREKGLYRWSTEHIITDQRTINLWGINHKQNIHSERNEFFCCRTQQMNFFILQVHIDHTLDNFQPTKDRPLVLQLSRFKAKQTKINLSVKLATYTNQKVIKDHLIYSIQCYYLSIFVTINNTKKS